MIRGTTPTIEITTDISLLEAQEIYVTFRQGDEVVERTFEKPERHKIQNSSR